MLAVCRCLGTQVGLYAAAILHALWIGPFECVSGKAAYPQMFGLVKTLRQNVAELVHRDADTGSRVLPLVRLLLHQSAGRNLLGKHGVLPPPGVPIEPVQPCDESRARALDLLGLRSVPEPFPETSHDVRDDRAENRCHCRFDEAEGRPLRRMRQLLARLVLGSASATANFAELGMSCQQLEEVARPEAKACLLYMCAALDLLGLRSVLEPFPVAAGVFGVASGVGRKLRSSFSEWSYFDLDIDWDLVDGTLLIASDAGFSSGSDGTLLIATGRCC